MAENLSTQQLKDAIWSLSPADRTALLTMSAIDSKRGAAVDAVLGLIELAGRMASLFSADKRFRIAERLRSIADKLELAPVYDGGAR